MLLLILILHSDWLTFLLLLILILCYDWLMHQDHFLAESPLLLILILCYDWLTHQDHSLAKSPLLVHKCSPVSLLSWSLLFWFQAFVLCFPDLVSFLALYFPCSCLVFLSSSESIDIPLRPVLFISFSVTRIFSLVLSLLHPNLTLRKLPFLSF